MTQGWVRDPGTPRYSETGRYHQSLYVAGVFLVGIFVYSLASHTAWGIEFPRLKQLMDTGQIYQALEIAEERLLQNPQDLFLLETAALFSFEVGDYARGSEHFKSLAQLSPKPAEVLVSLARAQERSYLHVQASDVARRAIELDSNVDGAHAILARCLLAGLYHEEARNLLRTRIQTGSNDREELLAYGKALLGLDQFEESARVLGRAVKMPGTQPEDRLDYGEALNGSKQYDKASNTLVMLLEEEPSLEKGYYLLGTALSRLGRQEIARVILQTYTSMGALEDHWYLPEMERSGLRNQACYERAVFDTRSGDYLRAIEKFRRAAALKPDDGPVVLGSAAQLAELGATFESREILRLGMERRVEPVSDFLFQEGEILRLAGQTDRALEFFHSVLEADRAHAGAFLRTGQLVLESARNPADAESFLEFARKEAPTQWEPHYWLGCMALELKQSSAARSHLEEAKRLLGGANAEILRVLGLAELHEGHIEEGSRLLLESMKLDRGNPTTFSGLEEGLRKLGDPEGAAKARRMQVQAERIQALLLLIHDPERPFEEKGAAFLEIADHYRDMGSPNQAVMYYRMALAAAPNEIAPYRALAALATDPSECFFRARNLNGILRLAPNDVGASRSLALFYVQLGVRLDRALDLAQQALLNEDSPEGRYVLAEVLLQRGDFEGARRESQAALSASPRDERFQDLWERVEAFTRETGVHQ